MANRNFASSRIFNGHVEAVHVDCSFTVASTDAAGLGITNLVGAYVQNIFMHTTGTPGAGNKNGASSIPPVNPNPAAGSIVIQLNDNFRYLYSLDYSIESPLATASGTVVAGNAYVLASLGTATAAQLHTAGVPASIVPAVGVAFISTASGTLAGSATASASATSGSAVASVEILGTPSLALNPAQIASQGFGGQIIIQTRNFSNAVAAAADGSRVKLSLLLSNSSVLIQGS